MAAAHLHLVVLDGRRGRPRETPPRKLKPRDIMVDVLHGRNDVPEAREPYWRPETRADCAEVKRPCPYVGCKHNLYLDATVTGLTLNFPDLEPDQMEQSCALDLADEGGITLEEVGDALNLVHERIRQIEAKALSRLDRIDQRLGAHLRNSLEGR